MISALVCIFSITLVVALALLALYHNSYRENWVQWLGLWGIVFGGIGEVAEIMFFKIASPRDAIFFGGLAAYAVGTAAKVFKYRRKTSQGWS